MATKANDNGTKDGGGKPQSKSTTKAAAQANAKAATAPATPAQTPATVQAPTPAGNGPGQRFNSRTPGAPTPLAERAANNAARLARAVELGGGDPKLLEKAKHEGHGGHPEHFSPAQVIAALDASAGIKLGAAQKLRCSYGTIQNYIDRYPEVKEACERIQEEWLDINDQAMLELIKAKNVQAVMFYARTKGRRRGYVETRELTTAPDAPLQVQLAPLIDYSKLPTDQLRQLHTILAEAEAEQKREKMAVGTTPPSATQPVSAAS